MCLEWLEVAARSDRWPIIIPAIFSAMEAILVPARSGLKAGVVTVRTAAVHLAAGQGFFDPGNSVAGYTLRNDLVHGSPTPDVLDEEATDVGVAESDVDGLDRGHARGRPRWPAPSPRRPAPPPASSHTTALGESPNRSQRTAST